MKIMESKNRGRDSVQTARFPYGNSDRPLCDLSDLDHRQLQGFAWQDSWSGCLRHLKPGEQPVHQISWREVPFKNSAFPSEASY